jgi:hypothetical protein
VKEQNWNNLLDFAGGRLYYERIFKKLAFLNNPFISPFVSPASS